MSGCVDTVKLARGMGSNFVSGTKYYIATNPRAALYGSFAHDLDLPLISPVTKVLDPVYLRSFIASGPSCGFMHKQSCGQVGKPVADLPLPQMCCSSNEGGTGIGEGVLFLLGYAASSIGGDGVDRVVSCWRE